MQTRLLFSDSAKNLEIVKKNLAKKYQNPEELFIELQRDRCSNPDKVDEYMLWHNLITHEKEHSQVESEVITSTNVPVMFKEEIILHTTDFYQVFTPRRMELLEYIHTHDPSSVKTLAEETGRDYKNVYDDVLALSRAQLLELIREGKNKRPVSRLTGIEILFKRL
jgi:predicted transcriptional regulator